MINGLDTLQRMDFIAVTHPRAEGIHTRQITSAHACYSYYVTLPVRLIVLNQYQCNHWILFICMPKRFNYGYVWLGRSFLSFILYSEPALKIKFYSDVR